MTLGPSTLLSRADAQFYWGRRTYRVDGQWNIQSSATLIGSLGMTVLRRVSQAGGAWINVIAPKFTAVGIVFDAGGLGGDSWSVLVAPSCICTLIENCGFINATGATLGSGLTIQARDGLIGHASTHRITGCLFQNNACHGLWVQAASDAAISHCQAANNGGFGICLDFNDLQFKQTVRQSSVTHSRCWNNTRGISVGNYNSTNTEPPRWGLENPDALDITVCGNTCSGNSAYGIAVSGTRIQVCQNQIIIEDSSAHASGILCNASLTTLANNSIVGPGEFGVDAGGSADVSIISNVISICNMGINAGGSARTRISGNRLVNNTRAVTLFQVETDGRGANFGQTSCDTWIEENVIQLEAGDGGVFLFDGPQRVEIARNRFISSNLENFANLCWAHTDTATIQHNSLNVTNSAFGNVQINDGQVQLDFPDIIDHILVDASVTKVDTILGSHQLAMRGQVSYIKVINGGQGYTQAKIILAGSGTGAVATAYLRDGIVIGISLSSGGSGYDPATTNASIIGDGTGAALQPMVGLAAPRNRRLSLRCLSPVHFTQGFVGGIQDNWTKTDITVAAGTELVLLAADEGWQAVSFENIDYLRPGGDGSVSLRSVQGDIRLSTAAGGGVRFQSDVEQFGFLTYFGRGSPEGQTTAPPGSDYRNLDGGIGTTLWLKRVGTGNSGWYPIA